MQKTTSSIHNTIFLSLLRHSRESMHLRQADLAKRLGRGQATVSKVERGERRLDVIELRAWLRALEVDFLTFMSELDKRLKPLPVVDTTFLAKRSRRRYS
jgi:transcriptional regulator with XRE-family HTH domain